MKRCCLLLGSLAALVLAFQEVRAAPLDAEACGKLNGERLQLEFIDARNNMAKGPEWAKSNLSPDAINQVRRLIEIDAQMLFRCTGFNLVNQSVDPDPDPPIAGLKANAKAAKTGQQPADSKRAAAKPAPKPKAKVDDAYRPPKADPNADPFAGKVQPGAK